MIKVGQGEAEAILSDGRRLTLRIDNEALLLAEDAADVELPLLMQRLKNRRMNALRCVLVGALAHHHPDIDRAAAATLMFDQLDAIMPALNEALQRAFPDAVAAEQQAKAAHADASTEGKAKPGGAGGKRKSATGSKPG